MVVRLNLKGEVVGVVKGDNSGVVDKGGTQPRRRNSVGGCANITSQEAIDLLLADLGSSAVLPGKVDLSAKGLVDTML
jgi:hypothetical protein